MRSPTAERLGWLAAVVFLDLNDLPVDLDHDTAFDLVMAVAEGRHGDVRHHDT